jgi:hypothetical protein
MVVALSVGWVVFRRLSGRGVAERIAAGLLPLSAVVIVWSWLATIGIDPVVVPWSAARLYPSMGLRQGFPLYYTAEKGPATGWIYPPLATLAYLPATFVPDPTGAVLTGRVMSLFFFFAPAAWLLMTGRVTSVSRPGSRLHWNGLSGLMLFCLFALLTNQSRPLRYCSTEIHADAPALCLAAIAVGLMARNQPRDGTSRTAIALILATLSVWTKQLTAPLLLIVLPLWAYWTRGVKGLFLFLTMALAAGLGISLILLAVFDAPAVLFNIVSVPLAHPWRFDAIVPVLSNLLELEKRQVLLMLVLAGGVLARLMRQTGAHGRPGWRWVISQPWTLVLLVAIAEFPISLLAYVKIGGDDNNLGFMLYFLTLGAVLLHGSLMQTTRVLGMRQRPTPSFQGVLILNAVLTLMIAQETVLAFAKPSETWPDQQKAALRYIREHRGEVYLPWNPLEHLAVEGRMYHFEYGVYDRSLARRPISEDHFRQDIPPKTRMVCYPPNTTVGDQVTLKYLKEFSERVKVAELPDWACYRTPNDGSNSAANDGSPVKFLGFDRE